MEANELMIGDLFRVNKDVSFKKGTIVVIRGIDADRTFHELNGCAACVALGEPDEMQGGVWLEYLEPIPITPEILEKNGFKGEMYAILDISPNLYLEYYYHEHRLREWWTGIDEWNNHAEVKEIVFKCQCHYIHELQHALRLCGIEKEIVL